MSYGPALCAVLGIVFTYIVIRKRNWNARCRGLPLPPSLKGLPILGNALDVPILFNWEVYRQWGEQLGSDVVYADAFGTPIVVLNTRKAAVEILDIQSAATSSRFSAPMACQLMGWGYILPLAPYDADFRAKRKLFQKHFHPLDPSLYRMGITNNLPGLLNELLENPEGYRQANLRFIAGVIFRLAYGIHGADEMDYYIDLTEKALATAVAASSPGAFFVDIFPFLKYVPGWFPGAGFKRKASEWRKLSDRFAEEPFVDSLEQMHSGRGETSFVSRAFETVYADGTGSETARRHIKEVAASCYAAGTETTLGTLDFFYLAMTLYPEVQVKAQKELDDYLKGERLPNFEDEPHLPYISAIVKEVLRWQPVAPLGVPHLSTEDCFYNGYFIPRGSVILANQWAMLYDEMEYPEPEIFSPERYLTQDGQICQEAPKPESIAFGFGRRVCPGAHMATSGLFMTIASILSVFSIGKMQDVDPVKDIRQGITRSPAEFKCEIKTRSQNAKTWIGNLAL
ncbi:cytochrome P450 [Coprinopsis marcescibilis]|uniref:Cytochrome P450 n=1 Tax=Coprinopsis marcescibilis TaxID=230819 RepID=A0A5C3KMJ3_COPMA|nr:cytochrome P450 [Coprinopsis marcescibilis]